MTAMHSLPKSTKKPYPMTDNTEIPQLEAYISSLANLRATGFEMERVVTRRRGTAMVCGTLPGGQKVGVKLVEPDAPRSGPYDPMELLTREAKWLGKFGTSLGANLYVADGLEVQENWLMMRWLDGIALDRWVKGQDSTAVVRAIGATARAVARLHVAGQVHGDLQPSHVLIDDTGPHLIDFALTHSPGQFNYRGAMLHFLAPEIAGALAEKMRGTAVQPIVMDQLSEIYSFGAIISFAVTGHTPTAYASANAPLLEKLDAIARNGPTFLSALELELPKSVASILTSCLQSKRATRAGSLDEIAEALGKL